MSLESNNHSISNGPSTERPPGSDNTTISVCTNECGVDRFCTNKSSNGIHRTCDRSRITCGSTVQSNSCSGRVNRTCDPNVSQTHQVSQTKKKTRRPLDSYINVD